MVSGNVTITGGSINGTTLGATTASTANVTTLTTSSTVTINGGTANGVAFLDGSKVLTTGSALTWNGSNLFSTGSITLDTNLGIFFSGLGATTAGVYGRASGAEIAFNANNSEQMRLTSAGLGIGTSSPSGKLDVAGASDGDNVIRASTNSSNGIIIIRPDGANGNVLRWGGNGANANTFRFISGGELERMRIDSSGNLGIGTSSTNARLDVRSLGTYTGEPQAIFYDTRAVAANVGGGINFGGTFTGTTVTTWAGISGLKENATDGNFAGCLAFFTRPNGSGATERMRLDSSGNLGLGVTPSAWSLLTGLQVKNAAVWAAGTDAGFVNNGYFNGSSWRYIASSSAALYQTTANVHAWYNAPSGTAGNTISFTQAMTLDANGNLGLGTTSPNRLLSLFATQPVFQITNVASGNTQGTIQYQASGGTDFILDNQGSGSGGTIIFQQAGNERARITSGGNFGIGTTNPNSRLDVDANIAANTTVLSLTNSANWGWGIFLDFRTPLTNGGAVGLAGRISSLFESSNNFALGFSTTGSGTNSERARITSTGALLVGTTDGSQNGGDGNKLIAGGAVWVINAGSNDGFSYYNSSAAAYRFYVSANGTISATNTTISAISDQRLKENVQDLDAGLDKIMALKPRKFDWKTGKGKDIKGDRGFIAQEFEQVFPDLIDEWKDPAPEGEEPYKSVRQDLIPVLVKAIQELKAELDTVKAELATLKGK
jgi:hypothetical protein